MQSPDTTAADSVIAREWVARTGDVLRIRSLAGLALCELQRRPHQRLAPHRHRQATLSVNLAGACCETANGVEYKTQWPTVLFRPPGLRHENRYGPEGARSFVVGLPDSLGVAHSLPERPIAAAGLLTVLIFDCYRAFASDDPLAPLHVEELLVFLMERKCCAHSPRLKPQWLADLEEKLRAEPTNTARLPDLARVAQVHPIYLARAFRYHQGCSVGQFLRRQRLDSACRQLLDGDSPISAIAAAAGFSDQSHFTRHLKAATGYSPARLRRMLVANKRQVPNVQDFACRRL
jgi:AraC family transcriptional regulator